MDISIIKEMPKGRKPVKGHNAYIVAPLIEESETLDLKNVQEIFQMFMRRFESHEKPVLVSTTVIEVGINVPNATFMVIFNAERFGLSTLHQLRGRVGRSDKQSYCVLISDPKTENANSVKSSCSSGRTSGR